MNNQQINIPKLRFPEFKGEWEKKKLEEVFSIFNGYAFASNESVENGTLWVKIADVGIQEMKKDNLSFLPISFNKKHSKFLLKKGDFVIALTRPILNGKLKMAKIDDFFNDSLLNQRVGKIETNNSKEFIYSYLQKDDLIKAIENNIAGSDPPNLSPSEINTIQLTIPSLPEQSRIASFFSAIDEKLKLETQRLAALKQYKKGVMQKLFSQELRFKDENGNEFPDWKVKKLGEVLIKNSKKNKGQKYSLVQSVSNKHGFINQDEIFQDRRVASKDTSNYYVIEKGYFAYNPSRIDVGSLAYKSDNLNSIISPLYISFKAYNKIIFDLFLLTWFSTQQFIRQMNCSFEGSVRNTLNFESLSKMNITIPSLPEQTKIANFLSSIDDKIDQTENKLNKMQTYKKGLLQQMFV